jgi:hypothetical protein
MMRDMGKPAGRWVALAWAVDLVLARWLVAVWNVRTVEFTGDSSPVNLGRPWGLVAVVAAMTFFAAALTWRWEHTRGPSAHRRH